MLLSPGRPVTRTRIGASAVIARALAAHGLTADPALHGAGDFSEQSGDAAIRELLARGTAFSAVFAADDEMAIAAMNALRAAGKHIPRDVAVVGFDDIAGARYVQPPLTTVRADRAGRA